MTAHRGVRERVKARREEIVRKAAQAFRERGYHNTSIEDIARELNLTKASLYYYVHGKPDLLFEAHRFAMEVLLKGLKEIYGSDRPPREKLERAIHHHIRSVVDERSRATMLLQQEYALSPAQRRKIIAMRDEYETLFRSILETGVSRQEFKAIDPKIVGFAIIGALNWMPHWYTQSGALSKDEIADVFADYLVGALVDGGSTGAMNGDDRSPALFDLNGRVVVVTGARHGIGRAVAWDLARRRAMVVVVDRDAATLAELIRPIAAGGRDVECIEADVTCSLGAEDVRDRVMKRFGRIDGLVHATDVADARPLLSMDEAEWHRLIEIPFTGAFRIVRAVAAPMAASKKGSIVLLSSLAGRRGDERNLGRYAACQRGVDGLTRTLAGELAPYHVRVNTILHSAALDDPDGAVNTVNFLLAPASARVTGQVLSLDAGL
jgi:NAD(P)-dependent dehydrogenase (short-subunit alcohol dehydrogenase family)/AcrR family transcriptional regulator